MISIEKGVMQGRVRLPPSKSHSLRASLFASLAKGTSVIHNVLDSPDSDAMIRACTSLGAKIEKEKSSLIIKGPLIGAEAVLDAGNSGQVLRFVAAVAALFTKPVTIIGDASLETRRPCAPLLSALSQLGAKTFSATGYAPISVQGPMHPGHVVLDGQDSQPVSAVMIAASLMPGCTTIEVKNLGERPWIGLTLGWLKRLGVSYEEKENDTFCIYGRESLASFTYDVPGDLSSLAFLVAAALVIDSEIVVENVDLDDTQGDKRILAILEEMGANFLIDKQAKTLAVKGPQKLTGTSIDVNDCIDALPVLASLGCFAEGSTRLYNGAIARKKESDRIVAMSQELKKMGATLIEEEAGLTISQSKLHGALLDSHADHRVAMALAVAALQSSQKCQISGTQCINKSYSQFFCELKRLGVRVS